MPTYTYTAVSPAGEQISGTRIAESERGTKARGGEKETQSTSEPPRSRGGLRRYHVQRRGDPRSVGPATGLRRQTRQPQGPRAGRYVHHRASDDEHRNAETPKCRNRSEPRPSGSGC